MSTFNGMITMNAHMMLPMAELGFYSDNGVQTTVSGTAFSSTSPNSNWAIVNWPAAGNVVGTNTHLDSMADAYAFVNSGGSSSGAGIIRYSGKTTKHFHIALTFSYSGFKATGGAHGNLVFGVFKNGSLLPEGVVVVPNNESSGGTTIFNSTAIHVMTTLQENDYIDLRVIGIGGSNGGIVTMKAANFFAMGI